MLSPSPFSSPSPAPASLITRRAFLRRGAFSASLLLSTPAWAASSSTDGTSLSNDDLLARAQDRIEKCRKGDGRVIVVDSKGRPVRDVKVRLQQLRHDFLFGCNLFNWGRCGDPDREAQYRHRFADLLNFATLGFYWRTYEPRRGEPSYDYTDQVLEWTRALDITTKGHPLVWDHPAGSPRWLPNDHTDIAQLSNQRVRDIVSRFQDRVDAWDAVNEPTHLPEHVNQTAMAAWGAALGPVPYVSEPLKIARLANPKALLVVNDYRTEKAYYNILDQLRHRGEFLFDIVGIQSHMHGGLWPLEKAWNLCDTYARLGLPIHFTETTLVSGPRLGPGENWSPTNARAEAQQARDTAMFYTVLFAHPAVEAITWWDFSDYHAWQGAAAGWLRADMSPKPVYERLKDLVKRQWWTTLESRTDLRGNVTTRAFYGLYDITIEPAHRPPVTRRVHWNRQTLNHFVFRL